MDNDRSSHADLHPTTFPRRNVELCYILPRGVSGAGMRFKVGPSNLIKRHKRDENDGKDGENEDGSEGCEEATSRAIVPSPSGRKQWLDFIGPIRDMVYDSSSSRTRRHHDVNMGLVGMSMRMTMRTGTLIKGMRMCLRSRVSMVVIVI